MNVIDRIVGLFETRGGSEYGGEAVTQLEHALQAARLAEQESGSDALVVAALLHDVGHLLHDLPEDAPEAGIDDHHENAAANFLGRHFPPPVTEPVRLHVAAKRYLCAVDPTYLESLSEPSRVSLGLQGGPMSGDEVASFDANPYAADAVRLRRWDDAAKVRGLSTPALADFIDRVRRVVVISDQGEGA